MSDDRIEKALLGPTRRTRLRGPYDACRSPWAGRKAPLEGQVQHIGRCRPDGRGSVLVVAVVGFVRSGPARSKRARSRRPVWREIQARGVIRIALRPDRPQVTTPAGARSGFDVDVATEIGRRLGLRVELVFTPVDEILAGRGEWDVGLPSSAVEPGTFATTAPYYYWPVRLIVPAGTTASAPSDLTGTTICVVTGSGGRRGSTVGSRA